MRFITTIHHPPAEVLMGYFGIGLSHNYTDPTDFKELYSFEHTLMTEGMLEDIFEVFNYHGNVEKFIIDHGLTDESAAVLRVDIEFGNLPRSMGVGDVIATTDLDRDTTVAYLCKSMGWTRINNKESN